MYVSGARYPRVSGLVFFFFATVNANEVKSVWARWFELICRRKHQAGRESLGEIKSLSLISFPNR